MQTAEIQAGVYWRAPFDALACVTDLVEFTVLDIEPSGPRKGKLVLADAQVALSGAFRSSHGGRRGADEDTLMDYEDSGNTTQIFHTRTHMGAILQPGDSVMGYHLSTANYNSDDFATLPASRIPDVILVRKAYPNRRKKSKSRNWQLRSIAKEAGEEGETSNSRGMVGRMGGRDQKKVDEDYELFLRELEEDPEMRQTVNLYKAQAQAPVQDVSMTAGSGLAGGKTRRKTANAGANVRFGAKETDGDEAMAPVGERRATETDGEDEEAEADFPEVELNELLEHFDELALAEAEEPQE